MVIRTKCNYGTIVYVLQRFGNEKPCEDHIKRGVVTEVHIQAIVKAKPKKFNKDDVMVCYEVDTLLNPKYTGHYTPMATIFERNFGKTWWTNRRDAVRAVAKMKK